MATKTEEMQNEKETISALKESYTFKEIIDLQKMSLEEKISLSLEVLRNAFKVSKHCVAVAFSGGKDSTVVADMIERFMPEDFAKTSCIFGNTGVEFPESLKFARDYGSRHFGDRFRETSFMRLKEPELKYEFAKKIVSQLEDEGNLDEILKPDGKLKGQKALVDAAKKRGYEININNCYMPGAAMNFAYCVEQYGAPLPGKPVSKLDAHRIKID